MTSPRPTLRRAVYVGLLLTVAIAAFADAKKKKKSKKEDKDRCPGCKTLSDNFAKEFGNTKGRSSGGGNSAWEEARGIKYDTSEQRLFEILDGICNSNSECNAALEQVEEAIEAWWPEREDKDSADGFFEAMCVNEAKVCCKPGFFGKSCAACPGGADKPCGGNGNCKGAGTRTGNGKCKCDDGYSGKTCSKCKKTHFLQGSGHEEGMSCIKCDDACKQSCKGPGAEFCDECKAGYTTPASGTGCEDVDECALKTATCDKSKYCANTPGNYTCESCDASCHADDGCTGPLPVDCAEQSCADGYTFDAEKGCTDVDECGTGHTCDADKYCYNTVGSVSCLGCATACVADKGCTDGTPEGCNACKEGFEAIPDAERGCRDIDECSNEGACEDPGKTCRNTRGSFECNCIPPKEEIDGKCVEPDPDTEKAEEAAEPVPKAPTIQNLDINDPDAAKKLAESIANMGKKDEL